MAVSPPPTVNVIDLTARLSLHALGALGISTRLTPATRSMAPPMPWTILPGIIQLARSPRSDSRYRAVCALALPTLELPPAIRLLHGDMQHAQA